MRCRTSFVPLLALPVLLGVAVPGMRPVASAPAASAPACVDALAGTWRGPATILGRTIVMEQAWSPALGGAFNELRMRHLATDTSTRALFEGRGFYRSVGARAADSVHGSWHDSRGIIFEVRGACDAATFSSHWSGSERGRTLYTLRDDLLEVIDSVYPPTGAAREFGRGVLRRQP